MFGGGIIPDGDIPELQALGVAKVFTPGAATHEVSTPASGGGARAVLVAGTVLLVLLSALPGLLLGLVS